MAGCGDGVGVTVGGGDGEEVAVGEGSGVAEGVTVDVGFGSGLGDGTLADGVGSSEERTDRLQATAMGPNPTAAARRRNVLRSIITICL